MMYKFVTDLVDVPAEQYLSYLTTASSRTRTTHSRKFQQISAKTTYYKNRFLPLTVTTWNSLPSAIADAHDLVSFKHGLSNIKFWICSRRQPQVVS